MTVYLDTLFLLNLYFDFLLLMTVSVTLKRKVKVKRLILGAIVGTSSILFLFLPNYLINILKIILAIMMCIVSFGLKDKKYLLANLTYFYMTSIVLGGFLYLLKLNFSNYILLLFISPLILTLYIKQRKEINYYQNIMPVLFCFKNGIKLEMNGFLDTGNKLIDPVTKKRIILVNEKKLYGKVSIRSPVYVPYNSLNNHGLLKCISLDYLVLNGKVLHNYLVGISESDLLKDGVDCVLNSYCLEDIL